MQPLKQGGKSEIGEGGRSLESRRHAPGQLPRDRVGGGRNFASTGTWGDRPTQCLEPLRGIFQQYLFKHLGAEGGGTQGKFPGGSRRAPYKFYGRAPPRPAGCHQLLIVTHNGALEALTKVIITNSLESIKILKSTARVWGPFVCGFVGLPLGLTTKHGGFRFNDFSRDTTDYLEILQRHRELFIITVHVQGGAAKANSSPS
ncbi:hypothetical protein ACJJTC_007963 [Scirpophaga incertulas]